MTGSSPGAGTFIDRYEKRGRLYTVAEVIFSEPTTGRVYAKQRHHQSFGPSCSAFPARFPCVFRVVFLILTVFWTVADQSPAAIAAWESSQGRGKATPDETSKTPPAKQEAAIALERERLPNPGEVGEVVELFGPVSHDVNQDLCERFAGAQ